MIWILFNLLGAFFLGEIVLDPSAALWARISAGLLLVIWLITVGHWGASRDG